jgi:hypothetical protein
LANVIEKVDNVREMDNTKWSHVRIRNFRDQELYYTKEDCL